MAPPTILVATTDEEKDAKIAKLQTACDDYEKAKVAMDEDKKDLEAKLKAADSYQEPGPEVHAKLIASLKKAMDDEKETDAKARIARAIKAVEEVFDTGNGVNTNAMTDEDDLHAQEEKKEETAVIASLTAKYVKPLIAKILQAKQIAGATSEQLAAEQKVLSAMKLPAFEAHYASQEIFIEQALKAQAVEHTESLFAKIESDFEFNGSALVGKTIDIDAAREAIQI
jgi:hypothetical protein